MAGRSPPTYWMDLGNRAGDGQFILGCPNRRQDEADHRNSLPHGPRGIFFSGDRGTRPYRMTMRRHARWPRPLERQSLFVNRVRGAAMPWRCSS